MTRKHLHLSQFGFVINWEKSSPHPLHQMCLRLVLNSQIKHDTGDTRASYIFTDAFLSGYGGACWGWGVIGDTWSSQGSPHINLLELQTVFHVVQHFARRMTESVVEDKQQWQRTGRMEFSLRHCLHGWRLNVRGFRPKILSSRSGDQGCLCHVQSQSQSYPFCNVYLIGV